MTISQAIRAAERTLPGVAAPAHERNDPRWQAILRIGDYIPTDPEPIWDFVASWGCHPDDDLRMAIATCLLEHLLEYHFSSIFPRVKELARHDQRFADTFRHCWKFGQSKWQRNSKRFDALRESC